MRAPTGLTATRIASTPARPHPKRPGPAAPPARIALLMAVLAIAVVTATGCGSSSSTGTSADPASVVPASAPVYVGAVVRPQGTLQAEAEAAGLKLTNQKDPYKRLTSILQTPGSPAVDYSRDVAPWLGPNAGLFVTSLGSSAAIAELLTRALTGGSSGLKWPFGSAAPGAGAAIQGAIVLDTSDLSAAKTFVAQAAARAHAHSAAFRGVSYQATPGGEAFAVLGRFVVLGTEPALHAVIETEQHAPSLKADPTYAHLQSFAPTTALAHVYENPSAPGARATAANSSSQLPALLRTLGGNRPVNVSLVPSASSLVLDADAVPSATATATGTTGAKGSTRAHGPGAGAGGLIEAAATGSQAFGELPGESWLAAGFGNVAGTAGGSLAGVHGLLSLFGSLGSSGAGEGVTAPSTQATFSVKGLLEGLAAPLDAMTSNTAQARRDFTSWMGEAGVFASGTAALELKGGVVIDSTDPTASRAAVAKLGAALRKDGAETTPASLPGTEAAIEAKVSGLPLTLVIADGQSSSGQAKFVIGLGAASVQTALAPPSPLSGSSLYSSAQSALGEGIAPSISVDFTTFVSLLEGVGLSEDPTIGPALPYLRASTTLSGGGRSLGEGAQRLRLVLGLAPGS
ncbi:MAG TPA: DUF3352 domain-containing protein [Solirubrobacteraceae bacterium]|nr:DUF3352 domain-containing protein [Solirubrobacteraceae bacterium]